MSARKFCLLGTCAALASVAHADPNDFVNPKYVVAARSDPATGGARSTIVRSADTSAKDGPWTVTDTSIRASTNDPHDYLSWAPYHWPECNWCGQTRSSNDNPPPDNARADDDNDNDDSDDGDGSYGQGKKKAHTAYENETNEESPADNPSNPSPEAPILNLPPLKRQVNTNDSPHVDTEPHSGLGLSDMMGDVFDLFGLKKEPKVMIELLSVVQTDVVTQASTTQLGADLRPTPTVPNSFPLLDATNCPALNCVLPTHLATLIETHSLVVRDRFLEVPGHMFSTETTTTTASGAPQVSASHIESVAHTTSQAPNPTALPLRGKKGKTSSSCTPSPTTSMPPTVPFRP
ncbi:hypothetical protein BDV93DRAFT_601916 [Ceratobasidium sp. AG-I]|nr:hypothetical protein BDV93DRAFT_601916 [Ceratobasidium sp. AG-I]